MLHTFYLADFTYAGAVFIRVASLGAAPLNIAPVAMTKREGGYSAEIDVPPGAIAVSYQSADVPRTIDINEIVLVTSGGASTGLTTEQNARLFAIPTNPLLADDYVAPPDLTGIIGVSDDIAAIAQTVATIAAAVEDIPTNPLLATSYVAPDNDAIADLALSVAQIPTTAAPAPSAIATAVQEALEPALDAIAASADKARAADTNKAIANPITGITTVFADDNTTPLYRILTRNANGEPALEDTVVREVVPLT